MEGEKYVTRGVTKGCDVVELEICESANRFPSLNVDCGDKGRVEHKARWPVTTWKLWRASKKIKREKEMK